MIDRREFSNALRILHSIDRDELVAAIETVNDLCWRNFRENPVRMFLGTSGYNQARIMQIIERRMK